MFAVEGILLVAFAPLPVRAVACVSEAPAAVTVAVYVSGMRIVSLCVVLAKEGVRIRINGRKPKKKKGAAPSFAALRAGADELMSVCMFPTLSAAIVAGDGDAAENALVAAVFAAALSAVPVKKDAKIYLKELGRVYAEVRVEAFLSVAGALSVLAAFRRVSGGKS